MTDAERIERLEARVDALVRTVNQLAELQLSTAHALDAGLDKALGLHEPVARPERHLRAVP